MSQVNRVLIADVAMNVLEALAFASSELVDALPDAGEATMLHAEIRFTGTCNGMLAIVAAQPLCCEWSMMLADDGSQDLISDALGEVANVIGGNWISRKFSADENIKLLPPIVTTIDRDDWVKVSNNPDAVLLSVEGSPFVLSVITLD